mmetsp:Transcript_25634/g.24493  ORF Transcript_25634/g.24493 Transcript_25634/m.24493 type:complete len:383 (-) Transcript_25634:49-1197(-)
MYRHETKSQPDATPYTKIVAAYGNRECPKLVEQAAGDDLQVRINALAVICDEFQNPYKIFGCAQSGAIKVLSCMVIDPDESTRERASKALSIAAKDACGLEAILDDDAVVDMLNGINDPSVTVRGNVYECICEVTRTEAGINACVQAGVTHAFVQAVTRELDQLKPLLLRALHNIASSPQGSEDALASGAVTVCASLLTNPHPDAIINAARTLGFLCSHEAGKDEALYYVDSNIDYGQGTGALGPLTALLAGPALDRESGALVPLELLGSGGDKKIQEIKAAAAMAIMQITSTDEGKRQMGRVANAVTLVSNLLQETDRPIRLCAVKVLANIAINPVLRKDIVADEMALAALIEMSSVEDNGGDGLLARHAKIALDAVNWTA